MKRCALVCKNSTARNTTDQIKAGHNYWQSLPFSPCFLPAGCVNRVNTPGRFVVSRFSSMRRHQIRCLCDNLR